MQNQEVDRIARHVAAAIESAPESDEPFFHLQPSNVFPPDFYDKMMQSMPVRDDYRVAPSRSKSTRTAGRVDTRVKIDLFPEGIRHLPSAKQEIWGAVGRALCSPQVREAFRERLAPGLERRFGPGYRKVGMYPIPMLTRDGAGHKIGVHPDTHWKGMSTQFYLPKDDSMKHVGTVLHTRTGEKHYERVAQISFSPSTGYAFAVDKPIIPWTSSGPKWRRATRFCSHTSWTEPRSSCSAIAGRGSAISSSTSSATLHDAQPLDL